MFGFSRVAWWATDPYPNASDVTSSVIAIGDAISWTATVTRPSGVTASVVTAQVSNWTGRDAGAAPNATFVAHSSVSGDGDDLLLGDPGIRYVRFQRTIVSGVSQQVLLNKQIG